MEWTGLNELREKYLSFFESKGHLRLKSFPLVPINDNSLFLINSGMAPMKKFFSGAETPPRKRVTTCQKCIRTPDIENVGKTARHGTYFEMLGNFSFGDYFKHEATKWAWEFCTEVIKLPVDKLWISIYEEDDEAFDIWTKEVGIDPSRIVRLGKADNFWEHGTGPCGPCSEIYFDRGEEKGCGSPDCAVGCECDRFIEFWNLVFTQFDSDGNGNYAPLSHPNIDTGMGLERLACIMQGVDNLFEVDTMQNIMKHIADIAKVNYKDNKKSDVSLRVITDHIRSTTFMIGDGVLPSNEGRGYVLRRLLRRAARHGKLLGIEKPFLSEVVETVVQENKSAYPELEQKIGYIKKIVLNEEENFSKTIDKGCDLLNQIIEASNSNVLSGEDAFKLYDTYGFPIDLTREIISEKNMTIDENRFTELMNEQRVRARNARATGDAFDLGSDGFKFDNIKTKFVGYDTLETESKVLAIIHEGELIETAISPQKVVVVTDITPFYAESGGQVADHGCILAGETKLKVNDVKKSSNGEVILHSCDVVAGELNVNDSVVMSVNHEIRNAIARNHTCAHILQAALIKVLGDHVHQAGQLVNEKRLRFDFNHFEPVTMEQLKEIENEVNHVILSGIEVKRYETDIDTAKAKGAMALFGEKYGNIVRVCEVGDYSMELCGGTHIENSSNIGLFKIISESSVAAGVRRIEAATGQGVLVILNQQVETINKAASELKLANPSELVNRCTQVMAELKEKSNEVDSLTQKMADSKIDGLFQNTKEINGVYYISAMMSGTKTEALRVLGDKIKEKAPNAVALLVATNDQKSTMLCVCGKGAVEKGAHAGKIVAKAAAITGGKGGGRPDTAMAGVNDNHKIDEALEALKDIVAELTSK